MIGALLERAKRRKDGGDDQPSGESLDHSLNKSSPSFTTFRISLGELKELSALRTIPNDATVLFYLGSDSSITAYGEKFACRKLSLRSKFPGVDARLPVVNFFSAEEAQRLDNANSRFARQTKRDTGFDTTLAWFDPTIEAIEVPIRGIEGKQLPEWASLKAVNVKEIIQSLVHEGRHARGEGEFWAYWYGDNAAYAMGLSDQLPDAWAILKQIQQEGSYSPAEVLKAEKEFEQFCILNGEDTLFAQYLAEVEKSQDEGRYFSEIGEYFRDDRYDPNWNPFEPED